MALTLTEVTRTEDVAGIRQRRVYRITGPASYTTGGTVFTNAELKLSDFEGPTLLGVATDGSNIRVLTVDHTNSKVLWWSAFGTEVANGTDLSSYNAWIEVFGR